MIRRIFLFALFIFVQIISFAQNDSVWNVMILKKGKQPSIKENMVEYSPTGFYLYRNCFYDIQLRDKTKQTLRLVDIRQDTLLFVGISPKENVNSSLYDTISLNYTTIDKILLLKDWSMKTSKKIKSDNYHFIFYKSATKNVYESKFEYVFPSREFKNELFPRLANKGITYHYEYKGKLYYHSGLKVVQPKYSEEEKLKTLKVITSVLDLILNKRINIDINY
ncbi:MAG: hypothetical protein PHG98_00185 [Bacteroidales bacterium]|nr:hypothetical protein [Bacteroidales bacterium]MDD4738352.1 hypothetical protein [Bacteroidales bacterium]